ncbi:MULTISPECIES: Dabb family protein [unclassified Paenibacillus]|uniref:Dabb family protein n=1 Tax=unclassified Paenibacillus TaxID=185978 RepID=UPI000FE18610|nr:MULTISPECIES: Dabb family protein [unclassified Paenibacillus]MCM3173367.1 Dabb family protein [Paenibacillus sp. MER 99-2]
MIKHIVLFKMKDRSPERIEEAANVLRNLQGKIDVLVSLDVGVDVLRSDRSFDISLTAEFASLDDLQAYQVHPLHQEVIKYMNEVREQSIAVDYEF